MDSDSENGYTLISVKRVPKSGEASNPSRTINQPRRLSVASKTSKGSGRSDPSKTRQFSGSGSAHKLWEFGKADLPGQLQTSAPRQPEETRARLQPTVADGNDKPSGHNEDRSNSDADQSDADPWDAATVSGPGGEVTPTAEPKTPGTDLHTLPYAGFADELEAAAASIDTSTFAADLRATAKTFRDFHDTALAHHVRALEVAPDATALAAYLRSQAVFKSRLRKHEATLETHFAHRRQLKLELGVNASNELTRQYKALGVTALIGAALVVLIWMRFEGITHVLRILLVAFGTPAVLSYAVVKVLKKLGRLEVTYPGALGHAR